MSKMLRPDVVSGRDINDDIRLEIAKELKINKSVVDEVCKSAWEFTSMQFPKLIPVRFQYLGVWQVKQKRLEHLERLGWNSPVDIKQEPDELDNNI